MKSLMTIGAEKLFCGQLMPVLSEYGYGRQQLSAQRDGTIVAMPERELLFAGLGVCVLLTNDLSLAGALRVLNEVRLAADQDVPVYCFVQNGTRVQRELMDIALKLKPGAFRLLPFGSGEELRRRASAILPIANPHLTRSDGIPDTERAWFFEKVTADYTGALADLTKGILEHSPELEFRKLHVETLAGYVRFSGTVQPADGAVLTHAMVESMQRFLDRIFPDASIARLPNGKALADHMLGESQDNQRFAALFASRPGQVQAIASVCYAYAVPLLQVDVTPRRTTVAGSLVNDIVIRVDMGALSAEGRDSFVVAMEDALRRLRDDDGEGLCFVPLPRDVA